MTAKSASDRPMSSTKGTALNDSSSSDSDSEYDLYGLGQWSRQEASDARIGLQNGAVAKRAAVEPNAAAGSTPPDDEALTLSLDSDNDDAKDTENQNPDLDLTLSDDDKASPGAAGGTPLDDGFSYDDLLCDEAPAKKRPRRRVTTRARKKKEMEAAKNNGPSTSAIVCARLLVEDTPPAKVPPARRTRGRPSPVKTASEVVSVADSETDATKPEAPVLLGVTVHGILQKFFMNRNDKYEILLAQLCSMHHCEETDVALYHNSRPVHAWMTPKQTPWNGTRNLDCIISAAPTPVDEPSTSGAGALGGQADDGTLELKFLTPDRRQDHTLRVNKSQSFGHIKRMYCRKLGLDPLRIRLLVDGEALGDDDTPESQDFETGYTVDVHHLE